MSLSDTAIGENGESTTVTATLDRVSGEDTTVTVAATPVAPAVSADYSWSTNRILTIAAGQTTSTGEVTLTAVNNDRETQTDKTIRISGRAENEGGITDPAIVTLSISDDDGIGVKISESILNIDEGGNGTYTVTLKTRPMLGESETVTVTPSRSSGDPDVTVSGALTFTTSNWSEPQTVTVSARQDTDAEDDEAVIGHAVSGGDYASVSADSVTVTVDDDETPRNIQRLMLLPETGVTLSLSNTSIGEDGGTTTVTARLDRASGAATAVTISATPVSPAVVADYSLSTNRTLMIAAGQTSSTRTVTLTAVNNDVDAADRTVTISGAAGNDVGVTGPADLSLTVEDDDERGVSISKTELAVDEGDDGTYTVELDTRPTESVTVTPSRSSGDPDVTVSGALTFTTSNWNTPQTVTVSAAEDTDAERDEATVVHAVSGGDYESETAPDVTVTVTENETASTRVTLTVDPSSVNEDSDETTVTVTGTLDEAPRISATSVTVAVGASGDTAVEGTDYLTVNDFTLTIAALQTTGTATLTLTPKDDAINEENETITVSGTTQDLTVDAATLTIENVDPLPQAWLARFGRMVADQVLEAVNSRMTAPRRAGLESRLAGQSLGGTMPAPDQFDVRQGRGGHAAWLQPDEAGWGAEGGVYSRRDGSRAVTARELLEGTSFSFTQGTSEEGYASVWSEGAISRFDGEEDGLPLGGEVTAGMLGADWMRENWMAGLVLSYSHGEGEWSSDEFSSSGQIDASVVGVWPWGKYVIDDRISVWGLLGRGHGDISLTPSNGDRVTADMDLTVAATGLRGLVLAREEGGGLELSATSDALAVWTNSEAVRGMRAVNADVTRLRLGLEGNRPFDLGDGATLGPEFEIGLRLDSGDAETGLGTDIGAGIVGSDPGLGLQAEVRGRGLLTHEDQNLRERGFAGSVTWNQQPGSKRGFELSLSHAVGASATGGMTALLSPDTFEELAANDIGGEDSRRLDARLGYGLAAFGGRFVSTPEIGFGLLNSGREYSLGWRLDLVRQSHASFALSLGGTWRESANDNQEAEPEIYLRVTAGW